jgi:hypothetical protein
VTAASCGRRLQPLPARASGGVCRRYRENNLPDGKSRTTMLCLGRCLGYKTTAHLSFFLGLTLWRPSWLTFRLTFK